MKDVLIDLIGNYVPDSTLEGLAQIDWVWIAGAITLQILIICTAWFACRIIVGVLHD